eukprot:g26359.t1
MRCHKLSPQEALLQSLSDALEPPVLEAEPLRASGSKDPGEVLGAVQEDDDENFYPKIDGEEDEGEADAPSWPWPSGRPEIRARPKLKRSKRESILAPGAVFSSSPSTASMHAVLKKRTLSSSVLMAKAQDSKIPFLRCFLEKLVAISSWFSELKEPERTSCFSRIVDGHKFSTLCLLVILANAILIIIVSDYEIQHLGESIPEDWEVLELSLTIFYGVELMLKILVHRLYFFVNEEWRWNIFDFFLVVFSFSEVAISRYLVLNQTSEESSASLNVGFLRLLRLTKLAKVLRVFRTLKFFTELRLMIDCVLGSFMQIFWLDNAAADDEYANSLTKTTFPRLATHGVAHLVFPTVHEIAVRQSLRDLQDSDELEKLFKPYASRNEAGEDEIALDDLQEAADEAEFLLYLSVRGIDVKNVKLFFYMLGSMREDNVIDLKSLVKACVRMKGFATSIDLQSVSFEAKLMHGQVKEMLEALAKRLDRMEACRARGLAVNRAGAASTGTTRPGRLCYVCTRIATQGFSSPSAVMASSACRASAGSARRASPSAVSAASAASVSGITLLERLRGSAAGSPKLSRKTSILTTSDASGATSGARAVPSSVTTSSCGSTCQGSMSRPSENSAEIGRESEQSELYLKLFDQAAGVRSWNQRATHKGSPHHFDPEAAGRPSGSLSRGMARGLCAPGDDSNEKSKLFSGYAGKRSPQDEGRMMTVSSERQVSLGVQLRAASTKLQNATAKRKALAQRAAHEVGVLLHRRKSLEAQRVEEEQRIAKAAAAKVAQEVAKFWRSCCRAAAYFEVQQRHKAKEKQHFDNIQALVSRSEAFSSEVTTQLFAQEEPGESGSDTSSDSGAGLSASPAPEALARAKKLRKPLTSSKASWGVEDGETLGR